MVTKQSNQSALDQDSQGESNTVKNPDEWKTGDEPMTGAQRSYLKTLSDEASVSFEEDLTKAEASSGSASCGSVAIGSHATILGRNSRPEHERPRRDKPMRPFSSRFYR